MSKPAKPRPIHYTTAEELLRIPVPPDDWFQGRGKCAGVPSELRPEDAEDRHDVAPRAKRFVQTFCGSCVVRIECARSMLEHSDQPYASGAVYGGMMPSDASKVWEAAQAIREIGSLEAAAAQAKLQVEGVEPFLSPLTQPST